PPPPTSTLFPYTMLFRSRRQRQRQEELWYRGDLAEAPGHPFYRRLNELLDQAGFDEFCEARCQKFYHEKLGRPSLAPGIYFRQRDRKSTRLNSSHVATSY